MKIIRCSITNMMLSSRSHRSTIAAATSRDLTQDMVRVKSSNIWSFKMNVKRSGDKYGDVYVQFKGSRGGPDDIYVYYDVPVRLYERWVGAPSKGHFFWQYIRNNFQYAKLTGDRRTKLKNGVNSR